MPLLNLSHYTSYIIEEINYGVSTERHLEMKEAALEKEWIIVRYLEDRNVKLIQAMVN